MRVVHAETAEEDFRRAVGHIIAVAVGVKEQVRRLDHKDAAVSQGHARSEVQAGDEILDRMQAAVAFRIGVDRDPVRAAWSSGRRLGDFVVDSPQVLIDLDRFETRRSWILQVLNHPEAATVVERHGQRLAHLGFAGDELDVKTGRRLHALDGFLGGEALSPKFAIRSKRGCNQKKDGGANVLHGRTWFGRYWAGNQVMRRA